MKRLSDFFESRVEYLESAAVVVGGGAVLHTKKVNENLIGKAVVDAAMKVHRELGPGLLESVCGIERVVNAARMHENALKLE